MCTLGAKEQAVRTLVGSGVGLGGLVGSPRALQKENGWDPSETESKIISDRY